MGHARAWVALMLVVAVMALAACGSSSKKTGTTPGLGSSVTTGPPAALTNSFRGVTSTSIKLGVALIDYNCIKQFIDFTRGNQQAIEQSYIDDLNAHGGVLGRKIDPVYKSYCPIQPSVALDTCTSFTQDAKVFAVVGVFAPTSPDAQLCLSRDNQTILIGHELHQSTIAQAPPGLLLTPDITAERRINVMANLTKKEGTLAGKKVAILTDQDTKVAADTVIKPALDSAGVAQGSTGVLTISGTDTSAAQGQLDSFIEKWKGEGVSALFLAGLNVSAKQFVEKIKTAMPDVLLLTDGESGAKSAAQGEVTGKKTPNPYEGIITAVGLTASETWKLPTSQHCAQVYKAASGVTVLGPDEVKAGPDGKTDETYQAILDFCQELDMFKQIAEKAGPDLTNTTWTNAVDNFGKIALVTASPYGSLHKGKYDVDDGFRLASFDSTIPPTGDWKPLTPMADASS
jgi:ABC-type branched-subunit amino acid transport system substrate-binding protein